MAARIVPAAEGMAEAVARLQAGQLVAFPTETVYGLGANALDASAVARIFAAKGRPSTNPLIVHVPDVAAARQLSSDWPDAAVALAARFWPGPLTLVVEKTAAIPEIVTAGGNTVGLRVPDHPVALELLRLSGVPLAAPSANRSEEVSPTTAQHVADSLGPWVDDLLVLDGGPTTVGIESTVVDVTNGDIAVLRPGMLSREDIVETEEIDLFQHDISGMLRPLRSPGQHARHYAPRAEIIVAPTGEVPRLEAGEAAMVWLTYPGGLDSEHVVLMPRTAAEYATRLYGTLRLLDGRGYRRIYIEAPPENEAIYDRLKRAATPKSDGAE